MQKSRYMLEKHGWSDGKGLGRHEHGRSKRLVIRRHTTTKGVGVDNEKWGDNWWQYAYNRALSHAGEEGEDAVSLMIRTRHDRSAALQSADGDDAKKALLYGMFVKPKRKCDHFLSNEMAAESPDSPAKTTVNGASSSSEEEDTDDFRSQRASFGNVLTDEQLFLFCGKRTKRYSAHGKLKRVMEQDLLLSASKVQASDLMGSNSKSVGGVKVSDDTDKARKIVTEEKSERKRKRKRQDTGEDASEPEKKDKKGKEKRKKKKRKTKSELSADEEDDLSEGEGSVVSVKKKKRKKRAIEPSSDEETSRKRRKHRESDVMDVEENGNVSEDKTTGKKKKEKKEKKKKEEKKKDKKKEKKKKKDKKKESEEKNDSRRPAMWEEEEEKEVKIESKRHEAVHKSSDMEACNPGTKRQRCAEEYDDAEERSHRKRRKRK